MLTASQRRLGDADREFASALELSGRSPYVLAHLAEYYAPVESEVRG